MRMCVWVCANTHTHVDCMLGHPRCLQEENKVHQSRSRGPRRGQSIRKSNQPWADSRGSTWGLGDARPAAQTLSPGLETPGGGPPRTPAPRAPRRAPRRLRGQVGGGTVFKTPGARAAHTPGQRKTLGAESHCSRLSLTIIVPFLGENGRKSQESFEESHLSFYMK